ncbi:MAG: winged helix-turn-helix domain-containing protein [Candidatus Acidiferrales bacterium]
MLHEIGEGAGRIWQVLSASSSSTLAEIQEATDLDTHLFYMSIGWLAREDKIVFEGKGNKAKLRLK